MNDDKWSFSTLSRFAGVSGASLGEISTLSLPKGGISFTMMSRFEVVGDSGFWISIQR
jgi:hypothetical protein